MVKRTDTDIVPVSRLRRWKNLFLFALGVFFLILLVAISSELLALQKNSSRDLPFGVFTLPGAGSVVQDFSYNVLFLRGIHEHLVSRPYRMEEQERMVRQLIPSIQFGMTHAYSPVALVLARPLFDVSGFHAYLIYFIVCIGGIFLLFYFSLLPKVTDPMQFGALAICVLSVCTITAFGVGQTAMLTTVLMGAFWALLQQQGGSASRRIEIDCALAVLFWAICFKPNVAFVPFILLWGAQSWRALALGLGLLLATWTIVSGSYGGWWTGLEDYSYLLNHYQNADFTPFMQRASETAAMKTITRELFSFDRAFLLVSSAVLVFLHWCRRITLSELFQLMVWTFLLFSPYLLPSEDWILCLLCVEGSFFKSRNRFAACGKLLLLACIFNLRSNVGLPEFVNFPCKLGLLAWLLVEFQWCPIFEEMIRCKLLD